MANSKISAIAQMLSSPYEGERSNAAALLAKSTGQSLPSSIKTGALSVLTGQTRLNVLAHLRTYAGDSTILAIGSEIRSANVTWAQLLSAASPSTSSTDDCGFNAIFEGLFGQAVDTLRQEQKSAPPKKQQARRIYSDDLPVFAAVIPTIERSGQSRSGDPYAVFSLKGDLHGCPVTYIGSFIAFGQEWVDDLLAANDNKSEMLVQFVAGTTAGKMPKIIRAV